MKTGSVSNRVVDFVCIGAPRAGTTFLDATLRSHPALHLPIDRKEVHYFDQHAERGDGWYEETVRKGALEHQVCGEITPAYLCHPEAHVGLAALAPDVRLIACLRDPVYRAYSHYRRVASLRNEGRTFLDVLESDSPVAAASLYALQLKRWLQVFPPSQLLVVIADDIGSPAALSRLGDHLGVAAEGFEPPSGPINVSTARRSPVYRMAKSLGRLAHRYDLKYLLKMREPLSRRIGGRKQTGGAPRETRLDAETYSKAAEYFRADALELLDLIDLDARVHWKELFA